MAMIEIKNLTKFFGAYKAVDDVSFTVKKGEILGFLGPNGAGKSTTMRMITGFIPPSAGTALIGGCDIIEDSLAAREKLGYLPENAPVYPDMTVVRYLDFCARIRGFVEPERSRKVEETLEKCFLTEVTYQSIDTLSKGFKQRVCFAQSILHDPEYLILDEPTDGLDPNQKHEVRQMIRQMSPQKVIILSTHILDEVDAVCSRAIIIANGRIVADATPDALRAQSPSHGAVCVTVGAAAPEPLIQQLTQIEGVKTTEVLAQSDGDLKLRVYPQSDTTVIADSVVASLMQGDVAVKSVFVEQGRLDEVFRNITSNSH